MSHRRTLWTACCVLTLSTGCIGSTSTPPDAGDNTPPEELVEIEGAVRRFEFSIPTELLQLLEGVEVCVWEREDLSCVRTDASGSFTLPAPKGEIGLTFRKDGYVPLLAPIVAKAGAFSSPRLTPVELAQQQGAIWDATDPYPFAHTGVVTFNAYLKTAASVRGLDGVTVQLTPDVGLGPFYLRADGYDPTLSTTAAPLGAAVMMDVPPGEYEVTFTHPYAQCVEQAGLWETTTPGRFRTPVVQGFATDVNVYCTSTGRVAASGEVFAFNSGRRLEGVRVCLWDDPQHPCTNSSSDGSYRISALPGNTDIALSFEKDGHVPLLSPATTTGADYEDSRLLFPTATLTNTLTAVAAQDPTLQQHGVVMFTVSSGSNGITETPLAGATVELVTPAAGGRVYLAVDGSADPQLTTTGTSGLVLFYDLPAGTYELAVQHPTATCAQRAFLWPAASEHAGTAPVVAGRLSSATMVCELP
ncbi:MAG: hypothetical protein AB2A00_02885 [Myxococcota bacterium]